MYVKLFEDILDSSLWTEPAEIVKVWITLLVMANEDGYVHATDAAIARRAIVTDVTTKDALTRFLSNDAESRTEQNEGRRIEKVEGGYIVLNYQSRRNIKTRAEMREAWRERQRRSRAKKLNVTGCHATSRKLSYTDAEAKANKEQADLIEQILKVYAEIKPPKLDGSRGRAKHHIARLNKKIKGDKLLRAAQNYKAMCEAQGTEPMYRRSSGNFFGRDAEWEEFASKDWSLAEATKDNTGRPEIKGRF